MHISDRDEESKAKVVFDYLEGMKPSKICEKYDLSEASFYRLITERSSLRVIEQLQRKMKKLEKKMAITEQDNAILKDILGKRIGPVSESD